MPDCVLIGLGINILLRCWPAEIILDCRIGAKTIAGAFQPRLKHMLAPAEVPGW